ncbi:MAG: peptidase [Sphingobacteriia bacterium]|nr:peptidase [Sphingobacteriia bacterium]
MSWNKKEVQRWFRILHRDIGYLAVGITLVYVLSGFFLSHKNIFSASKTETFSVVFPEKLNGESFFNYWSSNISLKLNHYKETDDNIQFFIEGGTGYYNKSNGETTYEIYKERPVITFLNQLHNNQKSGWIYIADIYAVILAFLAISGLFMVNGKNGFLNRGLWLMIVGIIIVLLFVFLK